MSDTEWWKLMCQHCGHWKVAQFEKADVAAWFRNHPRPIIRFDGSHIERESVCPHPCGTPLPDEQPMMQGRWPKKAGEDTVAWRDTCERCGLPLIDHAKGSKCLRGTARIDG